jgi:hypothetical protein
MTILNDELRIAAVELAWSYGHWFDFATRMRRLVYEGNMTNIRIGHDEAIAFWTIVGGPRMLDESRRDPRFEGSPLNTCLTMIMLLSRMPLPPNREAFFDAIGITEFVNQHREIFVSEFLPIRVIYAREVWGFVDLSPGYWIERFPQVTNTSYLRRRAFGRRLSEYISDNDYYIAGASFYVNRTRPWETSFPTIIRSSPSNFRMAGRITVQFEDEYAFGTGLVQEWFSLLAGAISFRRQSSESSGSVPLLSPRDGTNFDEIVRNNGVSLEQYTALGRLLAISIVTENSLGFNLPSAFYKKLLGQEIVLEDVRDLLTDDEFENIQFVMDPSRTAGELESVMSPLMQSGSNEDVSLENRDSQFASMIDNICTNSSPDKFDAISEGFFAVLPRSLFTGITPEDLRSYVRGNGDIDIADLAESVGYVRDSPGNWPQMDWLFTVLEEYDQPMRSNFLRFVTGRNVLPTGGFSSLSQPIRITRVQRRTWQGFVRLPTTHTCLNTIDLPDYESLDELRQMLTMAIENAAGGEMQG